MAYTILCPSISCFFTSPSVCTPLLTVFMFHAHLTVPPLASLHTVPAYSCIEMRLVIRQDKLTSIVRAGAALSRVESGVLTHQYDGVLTYSRCATHFDEVQFPMHLMWACR